MSENSSKRRLFPMVAAFSAAASALGGFVGFQAEEIEPEQPRPRGHAGPKSDSTKLGELRRERDRYVAARSLHRRPYARIKVFARVARMDAEIAALKAKVRA